MSKKKYYVVTKGEQSTIYDDWNEAQENGQGVSGAKIKGFKSLEEAESYQKNPNQTPKDTSSDKIDYDKLVKEDLANDRLVAFTDGGYRGKDRQFGYGIYMLEPSGLQPVEISDVVRTDKFKQSNNIGPEVFAVTTAMDWALSKGYSSITIYHDYDGISKWASGENKARAEIARWFVEKLESRYRDLLDIKFVHVPGHSGVFYNEEADRLATEAMNKNTKPIFHMNETYFTCKSVGQKEFLNIIENMRAIPNIEYEKLGDKKSRSIRYKFFYKDEQLAVTFYRQNSNTLAQGKPSNLFSVFLSYYTEKISDFELNQAYSAVHRVRIEYDEVTKLIETLNLPQDYPKEAIKFIRQSISEMFAMKRAKKEIAEDYGGYVFPAYRALEGHIKYLIEKSGGHVCKQVTDYFQLVNDRHILKNRDEYRFNDELEKAFEIYIEKRHSLAHFGELFEWNISESDTYMIDRKDIAIEIIEDILEAIKTS